MEPSQALSSKGVLLILAMIVVQLIDTHTEIK